MFKAVSNESANLLSIPSFIISLSTTMSMLCFFCLSRRISISEISTVFPSILALTNPFFLASSNVFTYSPFRPLATGAIICILVRSGRLRTESTIWSMDWGEISFPQLGQCGTPILAYNNLI